MSSKCIHCGEIIDPGDKFCGSCGKPVVDEQPKKDPKPTKARPKSPKKRVTRKPVLPPKAETSKPKTTKIYYALFAALFIGAIIAAALFAPSLSIKKSIENTQLTKAATEPSKRPPPKVEASTISLGQTGYIDPSQIKSMGVFRNGIYEIDRPIRMKVALPQTFRFAIPSVQAQKLGALSAPQKVLLVGLMDDPEGGAPWAKACIRNNCFWMDYDALVAD